MKLIFFIILFWISSIVLFAQDTITVVQYNLLYYGENTDWCTTANNNLNNKDGYLKTILNYTKPDIFSVNEMSKSQSIQQHMLDQVLNTNGTTYFKKADFLSEAESDIVNMLYYNSEKLALHSHIIAQNYIRDVDVYKLYHLSDDLINGDTSFIICVVAHLKSSSGSTNEIKRKEMAQNTMSFLNNYDDDNNYLMMGDFNLYTDTEPAYEQFLYYSNTSLRFIDPIDQAGSWHNNYGYRHYHTQSTHLDNSGCPSSGGMDDRFDFILISKNIDQGSKDVKYVTNSYWAVGQDGDHFNESVNAAPTNTSVPSDVLNALYHNSDHLPVTLKLVIGDNVGVDESLYAFDIKLVNPVGNYLNLTLNANQASNFSVEVFDLTGRLILSKQLVASNGQSRCKIPVSTIKAGFYVIRVSNKNSMVISKKVVKL